MLNVSCGNRHTTMNDVPKHPCYCVETKINCDWCKQYDN